MTTRSPRILALALLLGVGACASQPSSTNDRSAAQTPARPTALPPAALGDRTIGRSVLGEPIKVRTRGSGPLRVLLIGLIHGDEPEGYGRFDTLWRSLDTAEMRSLATIHAVPTMNPDGHAARSRSNVRGVDLNRNWPASNFRPARSRGAEPLSEPETRAVHSLMLEVDPDLIIVFHSARSGPLVDPDGPANGAAAAFVEAAAEIDPRWRVVTNFTNPPGSLGSYTGLDQGIAILTIEFRRGETSERALRITRAGVPAAIRFAAGVR